MAQQVTKVTSVPWGVPRAAAQAERWALLPGCPKHNNLPMTRQDSLALTTLNNLLMIRQNNLVVIEV